MDNPGVCAIIRPMGLHGDILIAGGALNGMTLALALARAGLGVIVVDPVPQTVQSADDFDGRGYALALASQRLLQAIGVWGGIAEKAQPLLDIRITDGRAGEGPSPFVLEFDHCDIDESPMGYMVEDRHLRRALSRALEDDPAITVLAGDSVIAQSPGPAGIEAELASGKRLRARVLAGCDGRRSQTAQRAGIGRKGWDYGQTALVCAIAHEKPHNGVAHQFFMPPGPLAILPLPGNRSSIVWTETHDQAARIHRLGDDEYLEVLRPRFGDFLGAIALAGDRFSYPLNLTIADRFFADRVALVGDAAHGMHPIAGQGLNAGLKDVATLAEVLTLAHRRGEDIGQANVLERYERWRRFDVMTLAAATDTVNRMFSNDNPVLRLGRDIGLGLVNALPGLRRGLIREAAGLSGDLPRLLQGRPI